MRYRTSGSFESVVWVVLNTLTWIGIIGFVWNLFKPEGWLYHVMATVADNRPDSYYYVAVGVFALLAGKHLLDKVHPDLVSNLLTVIWAFAGTFLIVHLLPW